MNTHFHIIKNTRKFLLTILHDLTTDELNFIPAGFNNNIIWNVGHIIAAQQGVCYLRGGLMTAIDEDLFQMYKPDSKPGDYVSQEDVEELKELLLSTIDRLEEDYRDGVFSNVKPWMSRYGVEMKSIEDTIQFLMFHDGLHIGYIMSMKRCLK